MWADIRTVWFRELLDTVRDKRTLYMMVLLPIVLMPVLMAAGPLMAVKQLSEIEETVPVLSLVGGEGIAGLSEALSASGRLAVETVAVETVAKAAAGSDTASAAGSDTASAAGSDTASGAGSDTASAAGADTASAAGADILPSAGAPTEIRTELERRLLDKSLDLVVYVDERSDELLTAERPVPFEVVFNSDSQRSASALQRFETLLDSYRAQIVEQRLASRNLSPELVQPFAVVAMRNVVPEEAFASQLAGQLLGMIVPLFIAVWAVAGGMYTAIDAAAGEKERNSLESLVMTPVPTAVLVLGKFLAITTVTLVAVLLLIGSSSVSMLYIVPRLLGGTETLSPNLTWGGAALLFVVMTLFVALVAAIQLGMSVFSKSYREAQAYMTGLMFVVMFPAMFLMFAESSDAPLWTFVIPVVNVLLVVREIMAGSPQASAVLVTVASLLVLAAVALWGAWRAFRSERVVFRM